MASAAASAGRMPPPRRGAPYYDADRGKLLILPPGGGKAVAYQPQSPAGGFDARKAVRRAGFTLAGEAKAITGLGSRAADRTGALLDRGGLNPGGVGSLVIAVAGSIVGLILLNLFLSGPTGVQNALGWLGGTITKLVDPADTLLPTFKTAQPAAVSASSSPSLPGVPAAGTPLPAGAPIDSRFVRIAPDADRAGVPTNPAVFDTVARIAAVYGHGPLTITTGTRHNQYVLGEPGVQSDHWTGMAADVLYGNGTPGSPDPHLTALGQAALVAAGMDPAEARTKTGGAYNVGGQNILFNTLIGGNHFNHLHVGIKQ